jgi:hypothetical protein
MGDPDHPRVFFPSDSPGEYITFGYCLSLTASLGRLVHWRMLGRDFLPTMFRLIRSFLKKLPRLKKSSFATSGASRWINRDVRCLH